jgi:hypothetical protein
LLILRNASLKDANRNVKNIVLSTKLRRSVFKLYLPPKYATSQKYYVLDAASVSKNVPSMPSPSSTFPKI